MGKQNACERCPFNLAGIALMAGMKADQTCG
jgi:hypothetical protein